MLTAVKAKTTRILSVMREASALILVVENGRIRLEPFSDAIIRIVYTQKETFSEGQSLGVIAKPQPTTWTFIEDTSQIVFKTACIQLVVAKDTGAFTYYDIHGKRLAGEPATGGKVLSAFDSYKSILDDSSVVEKIQTPDGIKEVVRDAKRVFDKSLYQARLSFSFEKDEAIYGLGSHEEGTLNFRGTRQYLHQANLKIGIPVFVSTNGYGILMDTYAPLIFNDNAYGSYLHTLAVEELDYYFIFGGNLDGVIKGYRTLTGTASLLPQWAFGYMQSMERYETQQEILDTAAEYRRRGVPLDSIVLDWQSWEGNLWGQKTFDNSRFPDPKAMTESLHQLGVRMMISVWPNMCKESENYRQMKDANCLLPQSEIYNAFDEKARALYWQQANDGLFSNGVDAWWCDSSEPFTPEWNDPVKPEPDANFYAFHNTAKNYLEETQTNAYPLLHAKAIYDGQRQTTNEKRVVNLTRSACTGQQRYSTILWSGDTSANWTTLKNQIAAGLNFCASGLPYWTLDIGAFFVKKGHMWFWDGDYEDGCNDPGYRELYTRWYQFGAFLPVFRSHGTDTRREIWHFGEKCEPFYDSIEKITRLRYQLMPYIYSLAAMVTFQDYTMLRLLAFDFAGDVAVHAIADQYMFGPSLMVCPVTAPMYTTVVAPKEREVYLPKDNLWYDFWTGAAFTGGQNITANAPIDCIPLYVKAGAIIPMAKVAQHTGAISRSDITLQIYPGQDGQFTLYQDETDNYGYENGHYATIEMTWDDAAASLTLHARQGQYPGMPLEILFTVAVLGMTTQTVVYHGETICVNA